MSKERIILDVIKRVYEYKEGSIISKSDIDCIEEYYKQHFMDDYNTFDEFIKSDAKFFNLVSKVDSVRDELHKQFDAKKGLQPGILTECVLLCTLANILGLKYYKDMESKMYLDEIPKCIYNTLQTKSQTISAARYLYYNNRNNPDIILLQYGNPMIGDACLNIQGVEVIIEVKDLPARLVEKDLLYDEDGKLDTTDLEELYVPYVEKFNKDTSIFECTGNYKIFSGIDSNKEKIEFLNSYLNYLNVDILLTSIKDELVAVKSLDFNVAYPDGTLLMDVTNSEIRRVGKNATKVFTPGQCNKFLIFNNGETTTSDICKILKSETEERKARGKINVERIKFNHVFYVKLADILNRTGDYYEFNKNKIYQLKALIALYINITKSKQEIFDFLYSKYYY